MAKPINKVSIQSLNAMFAVLEQQPQSALWIRSNDFQRQLYVNPNYETIWQRESSQLYLQPETLIETLYPVDRDAIVKQLANKKEHHLEEDNQFFYRIITPDGKIKFIKDWHYMLSDDAGNQIGYAGLAQDLTQAEWQAESVNYKQRQSSDSRALLQRYVFDILQNEMHISVTGVTGRESADEKTPTIHVLDNNKQGVILSRRERDVIIHLREGKTAKQTANELHVSTRTVEFHLNNIKDKVGCRTKLELLSRIQA